MLPFCTVHLGLLIIPTCLSFLDYGVNSILYQRGIYPAESFTRAQKYGLTLLVTADEKLKAYLDEVSFKCGVVRVLYLCHVLSCQVISD